MIEKAPIILIFLYICSFSLIGVQYGIGDVFHIDITNYNGDELKGPINNITNMTTLNTVTSNIANGNYDLTDVATAFIAAGSVVVQLLILLTGTYIFQVVFFMAGASNTVAIFLGGMTIIYVILLARSLIAYIRGV